eukprot:CAMPEP_0119266222 /NCGR_PEP_ID=MMETSP1329-20130426/4780_1 /TAXON_ID=114041 /ORGANISM="Genus nov. species nov., Strain RCC1024" /LENGTH=389 /DNA_ID=CAMNT_0007266091 /DNA_START=103 /DNA_END=1268 /DNA_ORIENTATION=-
MQRLPEECQLACLGRVPARDLGSAASVCRAWNSCIASTAFAAERRRSGFLESRVVVVMNNSERGPSDVVEDDLWFVLEPASDGRIVSARALPRAPILHPVKPHGYAIMLDPPRPGVVAVVSADSHHWEEDDYKGSFCLIDIARGGTCIMRKRPDEWPSFATVGTAAGEIVMCGGFASLGGSFNPHARCCIMEGGSWVAGPDLPCDLSGGFTSNIGGALYVVGGFCAVSTPMRRVLCFANGVWTQRAETPVAGICGAFSALHGRLHALVCGEGGFENDGEPLVDGPRNHCIYDPATDSWTSSTLLPDTIEVKLDKTGDHSPAILLPLEQEGRLLLFSQTLPCHDFSSMKLHVYDDAAATWRTDVEASAFIGALERAIPDRELFYDELGRG